MTSSIPPTPDSATTPPTRRLGALLALVAGYVDTLGFVALFGLFTSHVTGNFVLLGKELSGTGDGVLIKLLAFPAFIGAVAATRLIALAAQRRGHSPVRGLFVLQAALLLCFMAAGLAARPLTAPDAPLAITAGLLGALAMGVQNAQGRLDLASLVPTTMMTGNVTQLVIDAVDLLANRDPAGAAAARGRMARMLPAVLGFGAGSIGGAFAYRALSFWALLLPIALLSWAALRPAAKR